MMIFTIAAREIRSLFLSPLAWAILAVTMFILAYLFLSQIEAYILLQPRLAALQGAPGVSDIVVAVDYILDNPNHALRIATRGQKIAFDLFESDTQIASLREFLFAL